MLQVLSSFVTRRNKQLGYEALPCPIKYISSCCTSPLISRWVDDIGYIGYNRHSFKIQIICYLPSVIQNPAVFDVKAFRTINTDALMMSPLTLFAVCTFCVFPADEDCVRREQ